MIPTQKVVNGHTVPLTNVALDGLQAGPESS